jgi:hypothetical protein
MWRGTMQTLIATLLFVHSAVHLAAWQRTPSL